MAKTDTGDDIQKKGGKRALSARKGAGAQYGAQKRPVLAKPVPLPPFANAAAAVDASQHAHAPVSSKRQKTISFVLHAIDPTPSTQEETDDNGIHILLTRQERHYLSTVSEAERRRLITALRPECMVVPLRFRVASSALPASIKSDILAKLAGECHNGKFEAWVEKALKLPLGVFTPRPNLSMDTIPVWIADARKKLEHCIYGQHAVKDQIIRQLVQFATTGASRPFALGLKGPPGIGKTSVLFALARVLQRPYSLFSLGGASGAESLVGHSFTYEGSQSGGIANALIEHQTMDGLFFFDELDKISDSPRGQEIANVLMMMTDRAQNDTATVDRYFQGVPFDLSRAFMVFSFNHDGPRDINPILLNRLNVLELEPPSVSDKIEIVKKFSLPRALKASGMKADDVCIRDEILCEMISRLPTEPGMRGLEKAISRIVETINVLAHNGGDSLKTLGTTGKIQLPMNLSSKLADACLDHAYGCGGEKGPPALMYT